jgi:hypothetical protein
VGCHRQRSAHPHGSLPRLLLRLGRCWRRTVVRSSVSGGFRRRADPHHYATTILGIIGVVVGGAILVNALMAHDATSSSASYEVGQIVGCGVRCGGLPCGGRASQEPPVTVAGDLRRGRSPKHLCSWFGFDAVVGVGRHQQNATVDEPRTVVSRLPVSRSFGSSGRCNTR